jgi:hypothetical protein
MDIATLLVQLLSGAGAGQLAGKAIPNLSLGGVGNLLAGLVGGGLGSQVIASMLGTGATAVSAAGGDADLSSIVTQILSGGAGGGMMTWLVGMLRQMFQPSQH